MNDVCLFIFCADSRLNHASDAGPKSVSPGNKHALLGVFVTKIACILSVDEVNRLI